MKKNKKIKKNNKLFIILSDSLNCLVKGTKCHYKISYFLLPFMPIAFLIIGYLSFINLVFKLLKDLFRK